MRMIKRRTLYCKLLTCAALLSAGCASNPTSQQNARPRPQVTVQTESPGQTLTATPKPIHVSADSCEMRLHDLCGPLLLYLTLHDEFPAKLADLKDLGVLEKDVDFNCPVTHEPYIYAQAGLAMPDGKGGILVCDSQPHAGIRWAIEIVWPENAPKPLALVIPLTEANFRALKSNP